jgi:hypothetical protein
MIKKITALIDKIDIPAEIKASLLAELRQVPEGDSTIAGANGTIYRCAGVIHRTIAPPAAADWLCQVLYTLTVPVDYDTVRRTIRKNRNAPINLSPDVDPAEVGVTP